MIQYRIEEPEHVQKHRERLMEHLFKFPGEYTKEDVLLVLSSAVCCLIESEDKTCDTYSAFIRYLRLRKLAWIIKNHGTEFED